MSRFRRKAFVGMKWFRSNIRQGARLALLALVIQYALSFGHFHAIAVQAAPAVQSALQQLPASNHDSDRHPGDACAICAVLALVNTTSLAAPPVLPLPQVAEATWQTADTASVYLNSRRGAFQPRAPPLS